MHRQHCGLRLRYFDAGVGLSCVEQARQRQRMNGSSTVRGSTTQVQLLGHFA